MELHHADQRLLLTSVLLVCRSQPSIGALHHVVLALDSYLDPSAHWTIPDACRFGSVRLLERIDARNALKRGAQHAKAQDFKRGMLTAATLGHLEVVKWLIRRCPDGRVESKVVEEAAKNGHLHVLQWLFDHHDHVYWGGDEMYYAVANNHLEVAKFLHEHTSPPSDDMFLIDEAARHGDLEMMEWLHAERGDQLTYEGVMRAVDHGFVDAVKWMKETFPESVVTRDIRMDNAAANGYLEMVEWLHEQHAWCTRQAMNRAAGNGHLDVVKFLHHHRSEGCTFDAMNAAAGNGHLETVKWLHANRTEGCTQLAMDLAAKNGFLEIVQWLHANRTDGCSRVAVEDAIANGHFRVAEWLRQTFPEMFSPSPGSVSSARFADF